MTAHRTTPSEVDAAALAELIADARSLPAAVLPQPRARRVVDLTKIPAPRDAIRIPDTTISLVEGLGDYGA